MEKIVSKFIIIIVSVILLMFLPSTTFATINMDEISLENSNASMRIDLNPDLYSSADAIANTTSSILDVVSVIGIIFALIPITILIMIIIKIIKMIITTVKNSKEIDKSKIISNIKGNIKRAKFVLKITLITLIIAIVLLIIGPVLIGISSMSLIPVFFELYGTVVLMGIISLIEIIFVVVLLRKIYQKYDSETEHALNMQKIISIFLIASTVIKSIEEIIILLWLGNLNSIPSTVFSILINYNIIIGVILLIDAMKLSKATSEINAIDTLEPKEDLIKGNIKIIVIGLVIIVSSLVINGVFMYDINVQEKQVLENNSLINSNSTSNNSWLTDVYGDEELFDRTQQAITEYENNVENENKMLQNLMGYIDNLIESESNIVSTNTMQDDTINETVISNTIMNGTNNVLNIDTVEPQIEKGDVNVDGKLSMTDLSLLKGHTVKTKILEDTQYDAADMNEDGNITMTDLSRIKLKMVGIE